MTTTGTDVDYKALAAHYRAALEAIARERSGYTTWESIIAREALGTAPGETDR